MKEMFERFGETMTEILYHSFSILIRTVIGAVVVGFVGMLLFMLVGLVELLVGSIFWAIVICVLLIAYMVGMFVMSEKADTCIPSIMLTILLVATGLMIAFMPAVWNIVTPIAMWLFVIIIGYASYKKWG